PTHAAGRRYPLAHCLAAAPPGCVWLPHLPPAAHAPHLTPSPPTSVTARRSRRQAPCLLKARPGLPCGGRSPRGGDCAESTCSQGRDSTTGICSGTSVGVTTAGAVAGSDQRAR